jgi:hypothetical protein
MSNPTTPFGWQMPTATDLVTDLPADFEVFGQAVATSMADLLGGTSGQVLAKNSNTDMDFVWVTSDDANAIQNTIVDAKGDLIAASAADTPARLAVGSNGETLVADSSTSTGLRWQGDYAAGKNKIINGAFDNWQRGTSLVGAGYLADRFQSVVTTTTITQSQQAFTAGTAPVAGYESSYFYRAVTVTGATAGSRALVQQPIEDVRTFAGQTVTISFWAKAASGTPAIGVELAQVFGSGGSAAVTAIGATAKTISTSWARYSVTASVPSISGKTIGTGSSLNLVLWIDAGSDFATRASSIGNQSGTFDIWGVQVEAGSVATAFQTATGTIQGELSACQRYYWRSTTSTTGSHGIGATQSAASAIVGINLPVTMRVVPTSIDFANLRLVNYGVAAYSITTITLSAGESTQNFINIDCSGASGMTANRPVFLYGTGSAGYIGANAEL